MGASLPSDRDSSARSAQGSSATRLLSISTLIRLFLFVRTMTEVAPRMTCAAVRTQRSLMIPVLNGDEYYRPDLRLPRQLDLEQVL
jgi:hypothetical protein